jgi:DNA transposition AAA+ family ATPase
MFLGKDYHSSSATVMWSCLSFGMIHDNNDTNDTDNNATNDTSDTNDDTNATNDTNDTPVKVQLSRTSGHRPTARSCSNCQDTPDSSTVSC